MATQYDIITLSWPIKKTKCVRALFVICGLITCSVAPVTAQDPVFSQFYTAPLQTNPAFAGIAYAPNFALVYRNQWPSLNNAYQTYAVSYDQFFREANSGVGVYVQADNAGAGILTTTKFSGIYSYRLKMRNNWELRGAIEASYVQSRLNWDKLVFGDQIDDIAGPVSPGGTPLPTGEDQPENLSQGYFDLSTGFVANNESFYIGIGFKHLNTPDLSFLASNDQTRDGLPLRMSVIAGAEFPVGNRNKWGYRPFISPGLMLVRQGSSMQINVGTMVGMDAFFGGVWYRHANENPDALIGAVGFRTGILRVTYSYDMTISALTPATGGSHEVGIIITLNDRGKPSKYDDCFSIFR